MANALRANGRVILAAELSEWRRQTGRTLDLTALAYRGADMVRQVRLFSRGTMDERQRVDAAMVLREGERIARHSFPQGMRREVGLGTTFEIYLPKAEAEATSPATPLDIDAPRGQGQGILILEDDRSVAELPTQALRNHGYEPFPCANRAEGLAVAQAQAGRLSAVLLDASLADEPRTDAPQLREAIPQAVWIVMSDSQGSSPDIPRGVDRVLVKPFSLPDLFRSLAEELARRRR